MARGLEKSWGSLRLQSPAKMAAGSGTGRKRSGHRGAVENDPSRQQRRVNLARSLTEREHFVQKMNKYTQVEYIYKDQNVVIFQC